MKNKPKRKITNWSTYNKALIQRGDLTLWIQQENLANWLAPRKIKKGRPYLYSNEAIQLSLVLKIIYKLPLRATQGLLQSLFKQFQISLPVPSYSQVSRRAAQLGKRINRLVPQDRPITDIVIDSTGLKVYGEGEWKRRQHGPSKRRTWRKLHLAVCADTQEIMVSALTTHQEADGPLLNEIVSHLPNSVQRIYGDGAYDHQSCYQKCYEQGITPIIPPRNNAVVTPDPPESLVLRNNYIQSIEEFAASPPKDSGDFPFSARKAWQEAIGYHKRSLAETAMYRMKQLFGGNLSFRSLKNQQAEALVRCQVLNRFTSLGMPEGQWVTP